MKSLLLAATVLVATGLTLTPAIAQTRVYISNAGDGTISGFQLDDGGRLLPTGTTDVGDLVMPMAATPDGKVLYAATRSKPFTLHALSIGSDGALGRLSTAPLGHNMLYISTDRSGRYLLAASNTSNVITVTPLNAEGLPAQQPLSTTTTRHFVHSIRTDVSNKLGFAPTLGENGVEQFHFDPATGALTRNDPQFTKIGDGEGPRHFVYSADGRHLYVVNQFTAAVAGFAINADDGGLSRLGLFDAMPGTSLHPGQERPPISSGTPAEPDPNAIWAADIEITPGGEFVYVSERTTSQIIGLRRDSEAGSLTYLGSTPTEKQPRDFAIDPSGRFLIVAGEKSGHASVYRINAETGGLTPTARVPTGKGSAWVEVVVSK
jgi:6-phosphogluconolactonase